MLISISKNSNTKFTPKEVGNIADVAELALKYRISTGVFRDNYRKIDNFEKADFIGLDIDEGMTLAAAKHMFSGYIHAILPTKSHRKEKNGKVSDRFRVFLQLEEPITNINDFYETWYSLQDSFGAVDPAAKDPSRQFYACNSVTQVETNGVPVKVKKWVPKDTPPLDTPKGVKGKLGKATLEFLALGAPEGRRNNELYKALRDLHQNNYSQKEAYNLVFDVSMKSGLTEDEIDATVESAYNRDPKYEARIEESDFMPMTVDELYKKKESKIDWLLGDILPLGALSIIAGPPKAGKSTLIRQLSASVAMGKEEFLKRKVKQGNVLYLALEEQAEVLKGEYKTLGLAGDTFRVFVGTMNKETALDNIKKYVIDNNIKLVVIDTLMVFSQIEDSNNYKEAYAAMTDIRELARQTNCHIMCVHHTNKSEFQGANSIMGSNAFLGGVDVAIIFKAMGERRYIQSLQRPGRPFKGEELYFDKETSTYRIGGVKKETKDGAYNPF